MGQRTLIPWASGSVLL